jgi:hypothetical protein
MTTAQIRLCTAIILCVQPNPAARIAIAVRRTYVPVVLVSHVMIVQLHVVQVTPAWIQYVLQTFVEQMQT